MEMKKCYKCKEEKTVDNFSKNKRKKDGLADYCKPCNRAYQKEHYKKNRTTYRIRETQRRQELKTYFDKIKVEGKCSQCSENDIACLDYHHVDSVTKDFNISTAINSGMGIETIQLEIDKCIVLCSNCHRKLHYYE